MFSGNPGFVDVTPQNLYKLMMLKEIRFIRKIDALKVPLESFENAFG